jgi:predicted AlkP superfamily pyrophosphatase or phosphodiesterase
MPIRFATILFVFAFTFAASAQQHPAVLMISIDGLRPDYVTHADEHQLRIPNLLRFIAEGTYAEGVRGVLPTVTYPSHTTLVTGVWPAVHGIVNNQIFDPEHRYDGAWYWYADQIRVPTLWDAAHAAGLVTASVSWPVTVDANSIDYNIPEYWRGTLAPDGGATEDRFMMNAVSRPVRDLAEMQQRLGPYMKGNETTIEGDRTRTKFSIDILSRHHPAFMTIHLSSLDEEEHLHAPFSPEADADLEAIDGLVGQLIAAARDANPNTVVVIVSDHGFAPVHTAVNLYLSFLQAGLITLGKPSASGAMPTVQSWIAEPWLGGGVAAIVMHDPTDTAAKERVKQLLDKLAADPANGIDRVLTAEEAKPLGGFPTATFLVTFKIGFYTAGGLTGPLVTSTPGRGTHGYSPDHPEMRASFFAMGPEVSRGRDVGVIDMRQIAPTVAQFLGIAFPSAEGTPLSDARVP